MTVERRVLIVAIVVTFCAFLDGAAINVALPAIERELGGGLTTQQWVVDGYLITLGALILIAGSLSDSFGRVRILRVGPIGFGVTPLLCAVAPTDAFLIWSRVLQGAAAALLVPSSLALIIATFPTERQGRAIGSWTAWTTSAFVVGPLLGGILVDLSSWRLIFAINVVPIAVVLRLLHGLPQTHRRSCVPDLTGSAPRSASWVSGLRSMRLSSRPGSAGPARLCACRSSSAPSACRRSSGGSTARRRR